MKLSGTGRWSYLSYPGLYKRKSIKEAICEKWGLKVEEYDKNIKIRKEEYLFPRMFHQYVLAYVLKHGPSKVASMFGITHPTILSNKTSVLNLMDTDSEYREKAEYILKQLEKGVLLLPEEESFPEIKDSLIFSGSRKALKVAI